MPLTIGTTEILVAIVAFVASLTAGLSGFAFGLVAVGPWLLLLGPLTTAPLIMICGLFGQLYSLWTIRHVTRADLAWPFIAGGVLGVPVGVAILQNTPPGALRAGFGVFLILWSAYMLLRPPIAAVTAGRWADGAVGFGGGVTGGLAGLPGALPVLWCDLRRWSKDDSRGVYQPFYIAMHSLSLVGFAVAGLLSRELLRLALVCAPGIILGNVLGLRLYAKVDDRQFRWIVLGLIGLSGVSLLVR